MRGGGAGSIGSGVAICLLSNGEELLLVSIGKYPDCPLLFMVIAFVNLL